MATVNGYLTSLQSDLYVNGAEKDKIKTANLYMKISIDLLL